MIPGELANAFPLPLLTDCNQTLPLHLPYEDFNRASCLIRLIAKVSTGPSIHELHPFVLRYDRFAALAVHLN
jgi:hypothetical protein